MRYTLHLISTVCLALIILTHAFSLSLYLQEEVMTAVVVELATRGKYTVYVLDVPIHVHVVNVGEIKLSMFLVPKWVLSNHYSKHYYLC